MPIRRLAGPISWFIASVLFMAPADPALGADCKVDKQSRSYSATKVPLDSIVCTFAGDKKIAVTFHRLSEGLAGSLVMGERFAETDAVLGRAALVPTEVGKEAAYLFKTFGIRFKTYTTSEGHAHALKWSVRARGANASAPADDTVLTDDEVEWNYRRVVWYLAPPDPYLASESIYLTDAARIIRLTDRWPEEFSHSYEECAAHEEFNPIDCIELWRYLKSSSELDVIEADTLKEHARIEREYRELQAEAGGEADSGPAREFVSFERYFALLRHITKKGWPRELFAVRAEDVCADPYSFRYFPRPMVLDVAVIENQSSQKIVLSAVKGLTSGSFELREGPSEEGLGSPMELKDIAIAGKGRVVVPLRMRFADGTGVEKSGEVYRMEYAMWTEEDEAQKTYERIIATPAGTVFESALDGSEEEAAKIRKTRESFLPPAQPAATSYEYGPVIEITGLTVGQETALLKPGAPNLISLTVDQAGGSCPHLYSWDERDGAWTWHGKVIHEARERVNQMTEEIEVPPGTLRFKLAEEEAEIAFIDRVALRAVLNDGSRVELAPEQPELKVRDGRYLQILAYRSEALSFQLPAGVAASDIRSSKMAITGYYRRYSTLLSERQSRPGATPVGLNR